MTNTLTPTITNTRINFPYIVQIGLYNEAGELVKIIAKEMASKPIGEVNTIVFIQATPVANPDTVTVGTPLVIQLPGVDTPETFGPGSPGASFTWFADNQQSQDINQGVYFIKTEQIDEYGHTTAFIKEITLLKVERFIEMNIYNSAGELIRTIKKENVSTINEKLELEVPGLVVVTKDGIVDPQMGNVKYGSNLGEYITWDGKDAKGNVVESGSYEVQMIMKTEQGLVLHASKTIIVLREGSQYLDQLIIQPNPFNSELGADKVTFKWTFRDTVQSGKATIRVYNVAGELIFMKSADLDTGTTGISWDMSAANKKRASRGVYVCVLETRNDAGYSDRKTSKLAIASYK